MSSLKKDISDSIVAAVPLVFAKIKKGIKTIVGLKTLMRVVSLFFMLPNKFPLITICIKIGNKAKIEAIRKNDKRTTKKTSNLYFLNLSSHK